MPNLTKAKIWLYIVRSSKQYLLVIGALFTLILSFGCTVRDSVLYSVTDDSFDLSTTTEEHDLESLWLEAEPISDENLEIWTEAIGNLGSTENRSCTYTKVTDPCDDCDGDPTRRSFYAIRHSLLQPGIKALMEWFDTPATHTVSARVEEKFDSTLEPPWTLLTLDDDEPTERERYSHFQEKIALFSSVEQKRARREARIPIGDFHPAAMKSWFEPLKPTHYLGTEDGQIFVGLQPNRKSKSPLTKHLRLTLAIDAVDRDITMFDQRSIRGFAPHFGLRISRLEYQGTLERDPELDFVVLNQLEYSFQVRLTAVFPSKNRFKHWYQDFECAGVVEHSQEGAQGSL